MLKNTVEDAAVAFWDVRMQKIGEDTYRDEWGIVKRWGISNTYPIPIKPSIGSNKDLDHFVPPDPLADAHFETLRRLIEIFKNSKAIIFFAHDAWEYPSAFRGTENLLLDFIDSPRFAKRIIDMIVDFQAQMVEKAIALGAEIIATGDDYCGTKGPIMSPTHFREFILPGLKRLVDSVQRAGAFLIKHTDGNCWPIIDMIVEAGIDALNPIQPDVMDIREVKRRYGHKIALVGNIDCGDLLCNGSPDDVERVVKQTIKDVAPGGGYILSCSNSIHVSVRPENYVAMLTGVERYGGYPISRE